MILYQILVNRQPKDILYRHVEDVRDALIRMITNDISLGTEDKDVWIEWLYKLHINALDLGIEFKISEKIFTVKKVEVV